MKIRQDLARIEEAACQAQDALLAARAIAFDHLEAVGGRYATGPVADAANIAVSELELALKIAGRAAWSAKNELKTHEADLARNERWDQVGYFQTGKD